MLACLDAPLPAALSSHRQPRLSHAPPCERKRPYSFLMEESLSFWVVGRQQRRGSGGEEEEKNMRHSSGRGGLLCPRRPRNHHRL
jgi:hypothetical protein